MIGEDLNRKSDNLENYNNAESSDRFIIKYFCIIPDLIHQIQLLVIFFLSFILSNQVFQFLRGELVTIDLLLLGLLTLGIFIIYLILFILKEKNLYTNNIPRTFFHVTNTTYTLSMYLFILVFQISTYSYDSSVLINIIITLFQIYFSAFLFVAVLGISKVPFYTRININKISIASKNSYSSQNKIIISILVVIFLMIISYFVGGFHISSAMLITLVLVHIQYMIKLSRNELQVEP